MTILERKVSRQTVSWASATQSSAIDVGTYATASLYASPSFAGTLVTIQVNIAGFGETPVWKDSNQTSSAITADEVNVLTPKTYELGVKEIRLVSDSSETHSDSVIFLST
jgi:hypothetical protein